MEYVRALDKLDWRLLEALQRDARLSFAELGRRVGLSPSAVAERVRRLEADGIVKGYRAVVDFEKVGLPVLALIRLRVTAMSHAQALRRVQEVKEIVACYRVTGSDCFVLKVVAASVEHLEELLDALSTFGEPNTSIVLSTPISDRVVAQDVLEASRPGLTEGR